MRLSRITAAILTFGAVATLALAPTAPAATLDSGSATGTCAAARTPTDYLFLRGAYLDTAACDAQDGGIQMALADCQWLDDNGNTPDTRAELAHQNSATVQYPFTFITAAINAYCPQYRYGL
ncbi:DUF732 domain-containing protein [Nocardia stercoris]|uniref:DUF732 domain-containing protein n=1 Tax=Nocardia stercoris TaxID=2483361 RepID=A0A3M2LB86_9NOCA|nr:DUF732 domain-containing protein [Nocardia stercoris]RMI31898.1 hypothetical protein EBN03_17160 [Nocardia stercoris]